MEHWNRFLMVVVALGVVASVLATSYSTFVRGDFNVTNIEPVVEPDQS